jgi:hypothetical protein
MQLKRKLIMKALTDPEFRKKLQENPEEVLTKEELEEITGGAGEVLAKAEAVDSMASIIPMMLLCIIFPWPW